VLQTGPILYCSIALATQSIGSVIGTIIYSLFDECNYELVMVWLIVMIDKGTLTYERT